MKRFMSLFYVSVATALVGSATGDTTTATECTLELEEGKTINDTMYKKVEMCLFSIGYTHMGQDPSAELIRETITAYCARQPQLQQCLEDLEAHARRCLDDTEQTRHRLYRQLEQLQVELFCENDGTDIVDMFRRKEESRKNDIVQGCLKNAMTNVNTMDTVSTNGFMLHTYAIMHKVIECLEAHKGQGHDEHLDEKITAATKVMNRMKCVKDGIDVLCKTIVDGH